MNILQTVPAKCSLSWSHYALLTTCSRSDEAREFYETAALRGGWSVRQLERQINSQFYERTALSRNKAAMLQNGIIIIHPPHIIEARRAVPLGGFSHGEETDL